MTTVFTRLRDCYAHARHAFKGMLAQLLSKVGHKVGCHVIPKHYYCPISSEEEWSSLRASDLIGLCLSEQEHLDLYDTLKPHLREFARRVDSGDFNLGNGTYMAVDADVYYALIRHRRPRRVIEIGSGQSTRIAAAAMVANESGELVCVEPYPSEFLKTLPVQLHVAPVQKVPLSFFEDLEAGDILFIDSTHVLRPGGDVAWEYCEILPRLRPGVLIHVHDIGWPSPYPEVYRTYGWQWDEQYLLQAIMAHNPRYKILWAGCWFEQQIGREHMERLFPESYRSMSKKFPSAGPSSLWFSVNDTSIP